MFLGQKVEFPITKEQLDVMHANLQSMKDKVGDEDIETWGALDTLQRVLRILEEDGGIDLRLD